MRYGLDSDATRQRWIDRGVLFAQATLGGTFLALWLRADATVDSAWLRWMAVAVAVLSAGIGVTALLRLSHSFRAAPTPAAHGRLERGGVYRWLRHPMYYAVLGMVLAGCLARPGPAVLTVGVLHFLFYRAKSRYEERLLHRRYPAYEEYRRRTWGLGP